MWMSVSQNWRAEINTDKSLQTTWIRYPFFPWGTRQALTLAGERQVMLGDFNLPEVGMWLEVETLCLRETAAKREEGLQGSKTRQAMLLLEFSEQFSLTQRVAEYTRKDNTLDLCWTNSSCSRDCYTIQNVSLSDHNYVALNYSITRLNEESKEEKNHFSTEIHK